MPAFTVNDIKIRLVTVQKPLCGLRRDESKIQVPSTMIHISICAYEQLRISSCALPKVFRNALFYAPRQ